MASKLEITEEYIRDMYSDGEEFRFDLLARKVQVLTNDLTWRYITDRDINTIACQCAKSTGVNVSDHEVRTVLLSNMIHTVHPLREYILSLPEYDPVSGDWIGMVAQQVQVDGDQQVWNTYFHKWFVAMVASWMDDKVVNHQVLVLLGQQGTGKTTWLEHLIPPHLRAYTAKQASVHELNKDDRIRVTECALINLDEIDTCSSRELNALKSLITTVDVNERMPYGHTREQRFRCASFCASGNNVQFLSDDTGNRRWLPFKVKEIQDPFFTALPYQLMYAQAWWLIQNGYDYWFDFIDIKQLEQHNTPFLQPRNEEELLPVYFSPCDLYDPKALFMTASEIHAKLKAYGEIRSPMPLNKFGELLKRCGFLKRVLHGGKRGFVVQLIENQLAKQHEEISELKLDAGGDSTI